MRFHTAVPISAGATGRVMRAYDSELGHEVALKLLHHDDPVHARRMLREAEAQARLDHPHITKVYGTGTLDGRPYISMELIDGCTLDRAAAALSDRDKAALLADVADALACAHDAGLVHRDLKPSNILATSREGSRPHAYVIDFGLVRDVQTEGLTCTGQLLGTPGYMAPELATDAAAADARVDIYSLGVILYELLTGRRPFVGTSAAELILQSLRSEPPSLNSLRPDVDPALARIVRQCLERDPDWRYADAAALRDDLRAFADGRRVSARRDDALRRTRRFIRRHPWRASLTAAAATLALGLFAVAIHSAWYARDQALKAQQYIDFAAGIESTIRLEYLMPAHDIAPIRERLRREVTTVAAAAIGSGPAARQAGQLALGRARAALGDDAGAREYLSRAWDAGKRPPSLDLLLGEVHLRLYLQAMRDAAGIDDEELRAREIANVAERLRAPAEFHLTRAAGAEYERAGLARALLHHLRGEHAQAIALLDEVTATLDWPVDALLLGGDLLVQRALNAEMDGEIAAGADALAQARARYLQAVEIARSHPRAEQGLCVIGGHLAALARQGASVEDVDLEGALARCDAAIGLDSARAESYAGKSAALAAHARLLRSRARTPDALVEEAVASAREALRLEPDVLTARRALGSLLTTRDAWALEIGEVDEQGFVEAIALLEQAQLRDPGDAPGAMALADARVLRGRLLALSGGDPDVEYLRAEQVLAAVAPFAQAPPAIEAHLAETRAWRGYHLYQSGREAEILLRENFDRINLVRRQVPGHGRLDRAFAYSAWTLADLLAVLGRDPSAEAEVAVEVFEAKLARDARDFNTLFNIIGPLSLIIEHRLAHGRDASGHVEALERYTSRLQALAGDRTPVDIQLQNLSLFKAKAEIANGGDPGPEFAASRQYFLLAVTNPIDRQAAVVMFADLVTAEHRWRNASGRGDPVLLADDLAWLEQAAEDYAAYPPMLVRIAGAFAVPPREPERVRRALDLLDAALGGMPQLGEHYAAERERLRAFAETAGN